jgi:DNA-binding NarL/FixJ family response regulator
MGSLHRTTAAVVDVARAALSSPPGTDVVEPVLLALMDAIGADVAGYYRHEWFGWTTALRIVPAGMWRHVPNAHLPTAEAGAMHAGIQFLVSHRSACEPFAMTDLVPEREWLALEMCRQMRPNWGRNYQLAIPVTPLPDVPETRVWVLGRGDRDFTTSDRSTAAALSSLLELVSRHTECRERQRTAILGTTGRIEQVAGRPLTHVLPRQMSWHRGQPPAEPLTERELMVLQLLEDGINAPGAAARLGISVRTVHKHTERIYRKLGAHNLHTALSIAAQLSLVLGPTLGND